MHTASSLSIIVKSHIINASTAGNAAGDITPWCSTLVDDSGTHIGEGAGNWGHCGPDCFRGK